MENTKRVNEKEMTIEVRVVATKLAVEHGPFMVGEGPHWDVKTQALYFVDVFNGSIHRYHPETRSHTQAKVCENDTELTIVIPVKGETNKYFVAYGCTLATVVWDGVSETVSESKILQTLTESADVRINDGKVSPSGILLAGTMKLRLDFNYLDHSKCHLYSFKDMKKKKLLDGVSISNGLAWSLDETVLYFVDSPKYRIDSYQYDKDTIELTNRKTIFDFKTNNINAFPNGMTIDTDGHLWIACFGSGQVLNVDPQTGKILRSIELPAKFITSVAFGGRNFEDLYVTSAENEAKRELGLQDGSTFVVTGIGVRGLPANEVSI